MKKSDRGTGFAKKAPSGVSLVSNKPRGAQILTLQRAAVSPKDTASEMNKSIVAYAKKLSW